MPAHRQPKNIPWTGIIIALIGILFCLYASSDGGKSLCVTAGCALNKGFSIAGVSAWHIGAAAFALYVICGLALGKKTALPLAAIYLAGDCLFLLLMGLTLPCVPCLIAGLLFALMLIATGGADSERGRRGKYSLMLGIWGILFVLNLVLAAKEYAAPKPMFGTSEAAIKIYFSPSCPACNEAVARYNNDVLAGTAALYPVAENDQDILIIETMRQKAERGASPKTALAGALAQPIEALPFRFRNLALYWRLWANKAVTFSLGRGQIPLIIYNGLPVLPQQEPHANVNAPLPGMQNMNPPVNPMDIFNTELRNCGGENSAEDCGAP